MGKPIEQHPLHFRDKHKKLEMIATPLMESEHELDILMNEIKSIAGSYGRLPVRKFLDICRSKYHDGYKELQYDITLREEPKIIHNNLGWIAKYRIVRGNHDIWI